MMGGIAMTKPQKYQIAFRDKSGDIVGPFVDGWPVEIPELPAAQLFVHHSIEPGMEKYWCVSEAKTGRAIVKNVWGRVKAVAEARKAIQKAGAENIEKAIKKQAVEWEKLK